MDNLFDDFREAGSPIDPPDQDGPAGAAHAPEQMRRHLHGTFPLRDPRWKETRPDRPFKIDDRSKGDSFQGQWAVSVTIPDTDRGYLQLEL